MGDKTVWWRMPRSVGKDFPAEYQWIMKGEFKAPSCWNLLDSGLSSNPLVIPLIPDLERDLSATVLLLHNKIPSVKHSARKWRVASVRRSGEREGVNKIYKWFIRGYQQGLPLVKMAFAGLKKQINKANQVSGGGDLKVPQERVVKKTLAVDLCQSSVYWFCGAAGSCYGLVRPKGWLGGWDGVTGLILMFWSNAIWNSFDSVDSSCDRSINWINNLIQRVDTPPGSL